MFLHGGGTVEGFDCFLPLAERFRLVVPYHPGFGLSGDRHRDRAASTTTSVTTSDLFAALGIDRLVLFGHSWGGWVAATFAAAHPERVRGLVLAAPYGLDAPASPLANIPAMSPDRDPGRSDE